MSSIEFHFFKFNKYIKRDENTKVSTRAQQDQWTTGITTIGSKSRKENPQKLTQIKFKISSKTPHGKKDSTKRHQHRHHKRQPGKQQFPIQVVTG